MDYAKRTYDALFNTEDGFAWETMGSLRELSKAADRIADALDVLAGAARADALEDLDMAEDGLAYWQQTEPERQDMIDSKRREVERLHRAHPWLKEG